MFSSTSRPLITTRRATAADIPTIVAIEASATTAFAQIPALADLAHSDAATTGVKAGEWLAGDGRVYLACASPGDNDAAVEDQQGTGILGFVAAGPRDAALYIAEISVRREAHGQGVGTALLEAVFAWARERTDAQRSIVPVDYDNRTGACGADLPVEHRTTAVSLTTYADVPWNGPWYGRRGFREVAAEEIGPAHVEIAQSAEERKLERPGFRRCCMRWQEDT